MGFAMDPLAINRRNRHLQFWKRLHPVLIGSCLVLIVAGITSYFRPLHASWPLPGGDLQGVCVSDGRLMLARSENLPRLAAADAASVANWFDSLPEEARDRHWGTSETTIQMMASQTLVSARSCEKATIDVFVAPIWAVMLAPGIVAAQCYSCLVDLLRRRGPADCRRCGFNLTGVVSGVCPNCGHRVVSAGRHLT